MKPTVLIVGDRRKQGVAEAIAGHLPAVEARLDVVGVDIGQDVDLSQADVDLILVFGGDGSILHVARRLGTNAVPVLGVNYGQFGFLADLEPEDVEEGLDRWLEGKSTLTERRRLEVRFLREGHETGRSLAFNDVVVARRELGGMVDVDVGIDGRAAVTYSGDGLIVATASGSTAHALAAGGPLVEPTTDAVLLVPLAPHALSARAVVIRSEHEIQLSVRSERRPGDVTVDGSAARRLESQDTVEIRDAHAPLFLVNVSGHSFYDALRRKLGWRGRSNYGRQGREAWEEQPEPTAP
ncbi:MAG: NAD(+)/NADH kinase [Planctomycetota bacterium]